MAAAAVLRSAGGALRRRPSAFPHALLGKQQQPQLMHRSPPVENVTPHRRLYSSDRDVIKAEVNKVADRFLRPSWMLRCAALVHRAPALDLLLMHDL